MLVVVATLIVAMQWFAAHHRASHALHGTAAELFLEHARAFSEANAASTASAHETKHDPHNHYDPFAHHSDASACVLFDAALFAAPVADSSNESTIDIAKRERGFTPALPLVALHALRARVRDPPVMA
jgi:hypothetical protein